MLWYVIVLANVVTSQSEIPDYICTQNLSIIQSPLANLVKEPLPYFIPYTNATCFRVGCTPDDFPLIPYNVGFDNESEISGTILYTKYGNDNRQNYNFFYNSSGPMVKQEDITILEKIDFCYILNNKTICKDDKKLVPYKGTFTIITLGNRLDIFSTINFQTNNEVDAVCPLVFDFGNWQKSYLYPILKDDQMLQIVETNIEKQSGCIAPSSFSEIGIEGIVYNKSIILLGEKTTGAIITKPENYYFVMK